MDFALVFWGRGGPATVWGPGHLKNRNHAESLGLTLRWTNTVQVSVEMRALRGQAGEVYHRGALGQKGKAVRAPARRGLTAA